MSSVGGGDVSIPTPGLATLTQSNGIDDSVASITGSVMVADPSTIGERLTLINGTLALNGDATIEALTQTDETPATFTLPSAILQAGERISRKTQPRGEPACR